jgi:hypothetical protein
VQGRRLTLGVPVLVAILVACASPATAWAKGGHVVPPSRAMEFKLRGSHGYSISVSGTGRQVSLEAAKGGSSAVYTAHGVALGKRIKARFGQLGRLSFRFRPNGPPRLVPLRDGNCHGEGEIVEKGVFVGALSFEGEQGYTIAHASRVKGKVVKTLKETCSEEEEGKGSPGVHLTILVAGSKSPPALLTALRVASSAHPETSASLFQAAIMEFEPGRLTVTRTITAEGGPDAFTSTESKGQPTSVTITPPLPFAGSATYQREHGFTGSWTGSLTGNFLGRGEVSLAGPEFSAEAARL